MTGLGPEYQEIPVGVEVVLLRPPENSEAFAACLTDEQSAQLALAYQGIFGPARWPRPN